MRAYLTIILTFITLTSALAQEDQAENDNGFLINLVQDTLSSDTRRISFFGIEGALSSNATIERITVADSQGIWLEINNASLNWTRSALLRGRLDISELAVERISVLRQPIGGEAPAETLPDPAEGSFQLPELPVAVEITKVAASEIQIAEAVFGTAAVLELDAALALEDGNLDARVSVDRLDGSFGELDFTAAFSNQTEQLDIDISLQEPPNGVVATLLNIENRPSIALAVNGTGSLADFDARLQLDADGETLVSGEARIEDAQNGRRFSTALTGNLQPLTPASYREFFAGQSLVSMQGQIPTSGGVRLDTLLVEAADLRLEGDALIGPDGFPNSANLKGKLGNPDGDATLLPVAGADTTLQSGEVDIQLDSSGNWTGEIRVNQLDTGDMLFGSVALDMAATVANLNIPGQRHLDATLNASIDEIDADDPEIRSAIGQTIELASEFSWSQGAPLLIKETKLSGNGLDINLAGQFKDGAFSGDFAAELADLAPFSGISGQELSGGITFAASGTVRPLTGGFDLDLTGDAADLAIGNPQVDPLLAGQTTLRGGIARDADGIRANRFRLTNQQVEFVADGGVSLSKTDLTIGANLTDIGLSTDLASGSVQVLAEAKGGSEGPIALDARVTLPSARVRDHKVQAGSVLFSGDLERNRDLAGAIKASAIFDGAQTSLSGQIELTKALNALRDFQFVTDGTAISGWVSQETGGQLSGELDLKAPDISTAAALALQEASGSVFAKIGLGHSDGAQNLQATATVRKLVVAGVELENGEIEADIIDLLGIPLAEGSVRLRNAAIGENILTQLNATAERNGQSMLLDAEAALQNGTFAELSGSLEHLTPGMRLKLNELLLQQGEAEARLIGQSVLTVVGETLSLTPLELEIEDGRLRLEGEISDVLALNFESHQIPLSIANTISTDLGVAGALDGTAKISGARADPQIAFNTRLTDVTAAVLSQAGLPPLSLNMQGKTVGDLVELNAALTSQTGIDARVSGSVPVSPGTGEVNLSVALNNLPLVFLNAIARGQEIAGQVSGSAQIEGPLESVEASFRLEGKQLGAAPLRQNGISALQAELSGRYSDKTITLNAAQITGPQSLRLSANGSVPLEGSGIAISISGLVPLALGNTALAANSLQAAGDLRLAGRITGSIANPNISGSANMQNGVFIAPLQNLRLQNIALSASLLNQQITLEQLDGNLAAGGRVQASGTVSLNTAQGMPADLNLRLSRAVYSDGAMLTTKLNSKLRLSGPLLRNPLISGEVNLKETNVVLPERFSINQGALLEVRHQNPPQNVRMTLNRAGLTGSQKPPSNDQGLDARLDVQINSDDRIFVRGWGLDAELGGGLRLQGSLQDVSAAGAFNMIRGRIVLAGKRLDFREGRMFFSGSLNPEVYFQTATNTGEYTVFLTISGVLPDPDIVFSSSPDLPEDEALAQLLFSTPLDELSAFQIAQLGSAVAFLTGGGRPGLVDSFRSGLRLDNLDFTTDEDGETAVNAGKYIDDNIYLDLEAQADGGSAATITLDLTEDIKARGSVTSESESSLGIFFERDY